MQSNQKYSAAAVADTEACHKLPSLQAKRSGEACCHFAPPKGGRGVGFAPPMAILGVEHNFCSKISQKNTMQQPKNCCNCCKIHWILLYYDYISPSCPDSHTK